MSALVAPVTSMYEARNTSTYQFGKDSTQQIEYRFNSQGFRSDYDYTLPVDYAFFGCSLVFGVGVKQEHTFSAKFPGAYNFGIADTYENSDIFDLLLQFRGSPLIHPTTQIAVVWTDRNDNSTPEYVSALSDLNITHFFCGNKVTGEKCFKMLPAVDIDVSGTHPGPQTHQLMFKTLRSILR